MTEAEEFPPVTAEEAEAYGVPNGEAFASFPETAHDVFRALEEHGDLTRKELAEKTGWSTSIISKRVSDLVFLGIVRRRPCIPNPRQIVYVFDPPGDGCLDESPSSEPIVTDGGRVRAEAPGTAIKFDGEEADGPNDWHHSVAFDGYEHTTACGIEIETQTNVEEVLMDLPESWDAVDEDDRCPECHRSIESLGEAAEAGGGDGGE